MKSNRKKCLTQSIKSTGNPSAMGEINLHCHYSLFSPFLFYFVQCHFNLREKLTISPGCQLGICTVNSLEQWKGTLYDDDDVKFIATGMSSSL